MSARLDAKQTMRGAFTLIELLVVIAIIAILATRLPPGFNGQWVGADGKFNHFAMLQHGKRIQLVFFDGSARPVKARRLWPLYWNKEFLVNYANSIPTFFPTWIPN